MPARSKGLTWTFNLRTTEDEKAAVARTVAEYAQCGIKISMNDAIRILIRRATAPLVLAVDPVRAQMAEHWGKCEHCTEERIVCPEGKRLKFAHDRLLGLRDGVAEARRHVERIRPPAPTAEPEAPAAASNVVPMSVNPMLPPWRQRLQG